MQETKGLLERIKAGRQTRNQGELQLCLFLLPKQFSFLINFLNSQIISFDNTSRQRVKVIFEILDKIQHSDNG
jgi:hypothetical protein